MARVGPVSGSAAAAPRGGVRTPAQVYRRFGEVDAARTSPLYAHLAVALSASTEAMRAIGTANAEFAKRFLAEDGIALVHSNVGGTQARRVDFRAASGQARCRMVEAEVPVETRRPALSARQGEVELF